MPKPAQPLVFAVLLMGSLGLAPAARGSLVVIPFVGGIGSASTEPGPLPPFPVGAALSGSLSYDPAAVTSVLPQGDPRVVDYGLPVGLTFAITGGESFAVTLPGLAEVRNDVPGGDVLFFMAGGTGGPAFGFTLVDPTGTALTSTALPAAFDRTAFRYALLNFGETVAGQGRSFAASATTAAVPEPATLGPALVGLALLAGGGLAARRGASRRPA